MNTVVILPNNLHVSIAELTFRGLVGPKIYRTREDPEECGTDRSWEGKAALACEPRLRTIPGGLKGYLATIFDSQLLTTHNRQFQKRNSPIRIGLNN